MGSNLKKLVAKRQAETGESYQAALRHVRSAAPAPKLRCVFDQGCSLGTMCRERGFCMMAKDR